MKHHEFGNDILIQMLLMKRGWTGIERWKKLRQKWFDEPRPVVKRAESRLFGMLRNNPAIIPQ